MKVLMGRIWITMTNDDDDGEKVMGDEDDDKRPLATILPHHRNPHRR